VADIRVVEGPDVINMRGVTAATTVWWSDSPAVARALPFVGVNLLQSSFTAYCPLEKFLARCGMRGCSRDAATRPPREAA
jgi:hypothetical protein